MRKTGRALKKALSEVASELAKSKRVIISGHVSPDGDCIGSSLALMLALEAKGVHAVVRFAERIPYNYEFLPGSSKIIVDVPQNESFDHAIILDLSDEPRLGGGFPWDRAGTVINIDHHATGDGLGTMRVRNPAASATGELVYALLVEMGAKFTKEIATNLYTAILTDTGSFHYSNSTREAFDIAGRMVECGASPWEIAAAVYESDPAQRILLLGKALTTMKFVCSGRVATLAVTNAMYRDTGANKDMTDQFVNFARGIRGVEVAAFLRQVPDGSFKVSIRSRGKVDVSAIGIMYGGGGHRNASGFVVKGPLALARRTVEKAVEAALEA
jgi:phosphoesterase RecJ-like protein